MTLACNLCRKHFKTKENIYMYMLPDVYFCFEILSTQITLQSEYMWLTMWKRQFRHFVLLLQQIWQMCCNLKICGCLFQMFPNVWICFEMLFTQITLQFQSMWFIHGEKTTMYFFLLQFWKCSLWHRQIIIFQMLPYVYFCLEMITTQITLQSKSMWCTNTIWKIRFMHFCCYYNKLDKCDAT